MKCQKCNKNEANVRYSETVNGRTREICLCSDCAKETGLLDRTRTMFGDMEREMMSAFALPFGGNAFGRGMLKSFFRPSVPELGGFFSSETAGDMPEAARDEEPAPAADAKLETENDLKARLLDAIADERYEDAAKLRDKIKAIKGE